MNEGIQERSEPTPVTQRGGTNAEQPDGSTIWHVTADMQWGVRETDLPYVNGYDKHRHHHPISTGDVSGVERGNIVLGSLFTAWPCC